MRAGVRRAPLYTRVCLYSGASVGSEGSEITDLCISLIHA